MLKTSSVTEIRPRSSSGKIARRERGYTPPPTPNLPILEVENLQKTFTVRGQKMAVVRDVSLQIAPGEVLAFLGVNGAGKTTTIETIAGLIVPDRGQVRILGRNPHRQAAALGAVGAVLEGNRNLYWQLTAQENLEYFGVLRGLNRRAARQRGRELIERFELTHKRQTVVHQLSRGMQQRVAIAVALMHDPQLLLLDEPTLGLDVESTESVKQLVRSLAVEGRGILLTTHQLDIAQQLSDRVAIIHQGQILTQQPTQELLDAFSGNAYRLELGAALDGERARSLAALGASIEGQQILVPHLRSLYQIFPILNPLPLVKVESERATLTDVFLGFIQGRKS